MLLTWLVDSLLFSHCVNVALVSKRKTKVFGVHSILFVFSNFVDFFFPFRESLNFNIWCSSLKYASYLLSFSLELLIMSSNLESQVIVILNLGIAPCASFNIFHFYHLMTIGSPNHQRELIFCVWVGWEF